MFPFPCIFNAYPRFGCKVEKNIEQGKRGGWGEGFLADCHFILITCAPCPQIVLYKDLCTRGVGWGRGMKNLDV